MRAARFRYGDCAVRFVFWCHASVSEPESVGTRATPCGRVLEGGAAFPGLGARGARGPDGRACYSVPLNIAEGSARKGSKEYRRFLDTAKGSLAELETIIDLSHDLGYMDDVTHSRLTDVATETGKTLYGLLRKISDAARRSS